MSRNLSALFLALFSFLSITACSYHYHPTEPAAYTDEVATPVFDQREWKFGWSNAGQGGKLLKEYVLRGESVEDWSELVSIEYIPKSSTPDVNLESYKGLQQTTVQTVCPHMTFQSIYEKANERMWKWSISHCSGQPNQTELVRAVKTPGGLHVFHYASKKYPLSQNAEKAWRKNLQAIRIKKG